MPSRLVFSTTPDDSNTYLERMRIANSGNVGIGTSAPEGLLHVGTTPSSGLIVQASGNVGIGTTNPRGELEINGVYFNSADNTLVLESPSGNYTDIAIGATDQYFLAVNPPGHYGGSSVAIYIDNTDESTNFDRVEINPVGAGGIFRTQAGTAIPGTPTYFGLGLVQETSVSGSTVSLQNSDEVWSLDNELDGGAWYPLVDNSQDIGKVTNQIRTGYFGTSVGIGVSSAPSAALEVAGQVKITGGSPGANKVLTSDNDGLATWQTAAGGAPTDADYIVGTSNGTLSAEQSLGALTTGLLKNTVSGGTGTLSTAVAGTDYLAPAGTLTGLIQSTAIGTSYIMGGNVGIGTSVPEGLLHVGTAPSAGLIVQASGNVGIGTTSPRGKLDVDGSGYFGTSVVTPNVISTELKASLILDDAGDGMLSIIGGGSYSLTLDSSPSFFPTVDDNVIDLGLPNRRFSTGYFGTSVVTPSISGASGLEVHGGGGGNITFDGGTSTINISGTNGTIFVVGAGNADLGTPQYTFHSGYFGTSVGIGVGTTPIAKLEILDTGTGVRTALQIKTAGTSSNFALRILDSNSADKLALLDNGNLGIGTTLPSAALEVAGQVKITGGSPGANKVLTSDASGLATWQATTAAPTDATYILQTTNANLTNAQVLSGLTTGLVKNTTGTGVLSIASAGTDFESPLTFSTGLTRATNTVTNNLSTGISGGQTLIGGTASSESLTITSTAHATKGLILFGTSTYDEANNRLGIGTTAPLARLDIKSVGTSADFALRIQDSTGADKVTFLANGNVGIGTTNPTSKLEVNGGLTLSTFTEDSVPFIGVNGVVSEDNANLRWDNTSKGLGIDVPLTVELPGGLSVNSAIYVNQNIQAADLSNPGILYNVALYLGGSSVKLSSSHGEYGDMLERWQVAGSLYEPAYEGAFVPLANNTYDIGTADLQVRTAYFGTSVGIGVGTTPIAKLDIRGSGTGTGFALRIADSTPTDRLVVLDNGNLGIGTTLPTAALEVNGQVKITGGSPGANKVLTSDASGLATWQATTAAPTDATYILQTTNANLTNAQVLSTLATGLVKNTTGTGVLSIASANTDYLTPSGTLTGLIHSTETGTSYIMGGNVGIGTSVPEGLLHVGTAPSSGLIVQANGNVGIGTTEPEYNLDVNGTGYFGTSVGVGPSGKFTFDNNGGGTPADAWLEFDTGLGNVRLRSDQQTQSISGFSSRFWDISSTDWAELAMNAPGTSTINFGVITGPDSSAGYITLGYGAYSGQAGDGTSVTLYATDQYVSLYNATNGTSDPAFLPTSGDNTIDLGAVNAFGGGYNRWRTAYFGTSIGIGTSTTPAAKLDIRGSGTGTGFALRIADSTPTDRLVVLDNGNVGIGTTLPGAALEVAGQVKITGGSPGANKVLTSDASGLATWQATTAAPTDATYILQTTNANLTNAQVLSTLATGLVKNTTGTGVLTIANAGTDYLTPSGTLTGLIQSTATGTSYIMGGNVGIGESVPMGLLQVGTSPASSLTVLANGKVGIGTTDPAAKLTVDGGSLWVNGSTGGTPTSGIGVRLMWIPGKAAFRAGYVSGSGSLSGAEWDDANIGDYSYAFGVDSVASGNTSFAFGYNNTVGKGESFVAGSSNDIVADGSSLSNFIIGYSNTLGEGVYESTLIGSSNTATSSTAPSEGLSIAIGSSNTLTDASECIAIGSGNTITLTTWGGNMAYALGYQNNIITGGNIAIGHDNDVGNVSEATGWNNIAIGFNNTASGVHSFAFGSDITVSGSNSFGFGNGVYTIDQDNIFSVMGSNVGIGTTAPEGLLHVGTAPSSGLIVQTNGNVGIGTTLPAERLEVIGNIKATNFIGNGSGITNVGGWTRSAPFVFLSEAGDNVGIGISNPGFKLQVAGEVGPTEHNQFNLGSSNLRWKHLYLAGGSIHLGANANESIIGYDGVNNFITFDSDGDSNSEMVIKRSNGYVGVGTTNPTERFEISGNVKLTGRIRQGNLGDLAEMMPISAAVLNPQNLALASPQVLAKGKNDSTPIIVKNKKEYSKYLLGKPEAGDVVVVDEKGGIRRSFEPFATSVVGIISTNPAQILRDDMENAAPVALSGIVPCKVTNENGRILPGDLLVSSSVPGHAMKSGKNPPQGTVIGKALGSLDENKEVGVVEVLVMLK